jgi:O-antigen biosynthesis protein
MAVVDASRPRVIVDGKFFRLAGEKFHVKGVAYGPFAPNARGLPFASPEQTASDFALIRDLGANLIRVYHVPPRWLLDLAEQHGVKVLVDIPWSKHLCFLDSEPLRAEAGAAVRRAVLACERHPAVFAFSVANEIPPDVVRWSGARVVAAFIDDLIQEAKGVDPNCLCTFSNFPPTEFLQPQSVDFVSFNVYLHDEEPFRKYLARLQMLAEGKPLLLAELGVDSIREGEDRKSAMLAWQIEGAFRGGLAGAVVFSFTDDWWRGGEQVEDWALGLTTRDRQPKRSFAAVRNAFAAAPYYPLPSAPKVSVVVACHNGERTLRPCLDSLKRLNYPDYEVILVDDGSTDGTAQVAEKFPGIRYFRHQRNLGLSAARNTGITAAAGEIIAFTDADCRADEDWLYYLVADLVRSEFVGMGGPNLLPPEDSPVAAVVMVSPGGPAHVMLTDRRAEHIPGCNMVFFKSALERIGGFDPIFTKAGDDVDLCWRLQQAGGELGFSPAAFVWHYRRSTAGAYLRQQYGYGEAEALLVRKHPEYFNSLGGSLWRGRIYGPSKFNFQIREAIIYRGLFGSAGFQSLYAAEPAFSLLLCTTLEYHVFVAFPLWILAAVFHHLLPLAVASALIPLGICAAAARQAELPRKQSLWWSRPLVALLFFLQPIVRGWARHRGRLAIRPLTLASQESLDSIALRDSKASLDEVQFWANQRIDRLAWVAAILQELDQRGWPHRTDVGWSDFDMEIYGSRWSHLQLATVAEEHSGRRQMVRCRLRAMWSPLARVGLATLAGVELLWIGLWGGGRVWPWLVLVSLPLFAWYLTRQGRNLQSVTAIFLEEVAKRWGLVRIGAEAETKPTPPPERETVPTPEPAPARPARMRVEVPRSTEDKIGNTGVG